MSILVAARGCEKPNRFSSNRPEAAISLGEYTMEKYGYVYLTTNMCNGKVYSGQNKGVFDSKYLGSGKIIRRAIKKYGAGNFRVSVLEYATTKTELDYLEKKYIEECRTYFGAENVYNITDGGEGGDTFSKNPDKEYIRKKLRLAGKVGGIVCKNKKVGIFTKEVHNKSLESQKKLGVGIFGPKGQSPMKGKHQTNETKQKIRLKNIGYKQSPEHIEKHRKSILGRKRIHNEYTGECKTVRSEDIQTYLSLGWKLGWEL